MCAKVMIRAKSGHPWFSIIRIMLMCFFPHHPYRVATITGMRWWNEWKLSAHTLRFSTMCHVFLFSTESKQLPHMWKGDDKSKGRAPVILYPINSVCFCSPQRVTTVTPVRRWWQEPRRSTHGSESSRSTHCWAGMAAHFAGPKMDTQHHKVTSYVHNIQI